MQRYCLSPVLFAWCIYGTFFFMAQQPLMGQGLVVLEASRSHSDTPPPLDEWSARRRDLYLTTHNTHKRQASMLSAGFEPANPASERPQTHALDRAVTEFGPTELNNGYWLHFIWGEYWNLLLEFSSGPHLPKTTHILQAAQMKLCKFSQEPFITPNTET